MPSLPLFRAILHPTDFTPVSDAAFIHALKIATAGGGGGRFTMIHADAEGDPPPGYREEFPHVRPTLERWGLLSSGSQSEDVFNELGVAVEKVAARGADVVDVINDYIEGHPVDLLVLATRGPEERPWWIYPSVSERLARLSQTTTLFVPNGVTGFVAAADGSARLRRVLVPIASEPPPHAAVYAACTLARMVSPASIRIDLLHVGSDDGHPVPGLATDDRFEWRRVSRTGDVVQSILEEAREQESDLIAMSTFGHHGFLDALRGSTTEQVVRRAPCPVLAASITGHTQRVPLLGFDAARVVPSTT